MHIPELLTTDDVAAMLKLDKRGVWRLVGRGELRPIKIGRKNRFTEADVWDFLARHNPGLVNDDGFIEEA